MSKKKLEYEITEGNVLKDLGLAQSNELVTRAKLLSEVSKLIDKSEMTQKEIASILGITQPKVSLLLSGRLSAFSADTLLQYLSTLGCHIEIRIKKPRLKSGGSRRHGKVTVS
ncbi:MAG: helix-turn-helix transcriptional regulator [Simkaniaceae bacterium]|nr:helix-turn-helix transcriptional regulator [Simkaniaceae bacterium]